MRIPLGAVKQKPSLCKGGCRACEAGGLLCMFITYFDNPFVTACAAPPPLAQGRLSRVIIPVRQRMRGFLAHARNDGRQGTRHNFGCASCAACGGEQSGGRSPQRPMRGKILACGSILTMQRTRRSRSKNPLAECGKPLAADAHPFSRAKLAFASSSPCSAASSYHLMASAILLVTPRPLS